MFQHFRDKDCLLLCLPERCASLAITAGFRTIKGDTSLPTPTRILQSDSLQQTTSGYVLYALHRDEVPFISHALMSLPGDHETRKAVPVVVKGLGFNGISRTLHCWGAKCMHLIGLGGKKNKKKQRKQNDRASMTAMSKKSSVQDAPRSRNSH